MRVYVAGPLFSDQDRRALEEIAAMLAEEGLATYVPHRDAGDLGSVQIPYGKTIVRDHLFDCDLVALRNCQMVVALLDGPDVDSGTAVEMGIAFAREMPVIGLKTDFHRRNRTVNNMIWGVCKRGATLTFDMKGLLEAVKTQAEVKDNE